MSLKEAVCALFVNEGSWVSLEAVCSPFVSECGWVSLKEAVCPPFVSERGWVSPYPVCVWGSCRGIPCSPCAAHLRLPVAHAVHPLLGECTRCFPSVLACELFKGRYFNGALFV